MHRKEYEVGGHFLITSIYSLDDMEFDHTANHPYLQQGAELRRTQVTVVKSRCILKALSAAAIRQLTMHQSLGVDVIILRREENQTTQRKTLEVRERPTTTTLNIKRSVYLPPIRIVQSNVSSVALRQREAENK